MRQQTVVKKAEIGAFDDDDLDDLILPKNRREYVDFQKFDKALKDAQTTNKEVLSKNVNLAAQIAASMRSTAGIRHVVHRVCGISKDEGTRRETAIWAVDSIMRHVQNGAKEEGLLDRYEKHLQSHLRNIFKRTLRPESSRRWMAEKFLNKILPQWKQRGWFEGELAALVEVVRRAAPQLSLPRALDAANLATRKRDPLSEDEADVPEPPMDPIMAVKTVKEEMFMGGGALTPQMQAPAAFQQHAAMLPQGASYMQTIPRTPAAPTSTAPSTPGGLLNSVPRTPGGLLAVPSTPFMGNRVPGTPGMGAAMPFTPALPRLGQGSLSSMPQTPARPGAAVPATPVGGAIPATPCMGGLGNKVPSTPARLAPAGTPRGPAPQGLQPFTPRGAVPRTPAPRGLQPFTPLGAPPPTPAGFGAQPFTPAPGALPGTPGSAYPRTPGGNVMPFTPRGPAPATATFQTFQPFTPGVTVPRTPGGAAPGTPGFMPFAGGNVAPSTPAGVGLGMAMTPNRAMPGTPGYVPTAANNVAPSTPGMPRLAATAAAGTPGYQPSSVNNVAPVTPGMARGPSALPPSWNSDGLPAGTPPTALPGFDAPDDTPRLPGLTPVGDETPALPLGADTPATTALPPGGGGTPGPPGTLPRGVDTPDLTPMLPGGETPGVPGTLLPGAETPGVPGTMLPGAETPGVPGTMPLGAETPGVPGTLPPGTETPGVPAALAFGAETPMVPRAPGMGPGTETPMPGDFMADGGMTPVPSVPSSTVVPTDGTVGTATTAAGSVPHPGASVPSEQASERDQLDGMTPVASSAGDERPQHPVPSVPSSAAPSSSHLPGDEVQTMVGTTTPALEELPQPVPSAPSAPSLGTDAPMGAPAAKRRRLEDDAEMPTEDQLF